MKSNLDLNQYPSIVQTEPMTRDNMKYSFIPTTRIIEDLAKEGWLPIDAQEAGTKGANAGFQKHLVRFANPDIKNTESDFQPNIVMTNAHNASASFRLMGGGINFVCLNGIVIAESIVSEHIIRHQGYTEETVLTALSNIAEDMPNIYNSIDRFKSVELSDEERFAFGADTLRMFYDDPQLMKLDIEASAELIVSPRRKQEEGKNLWNTFNVVQENMIRGGTFLKSTTSEKIKVKKETTSIDTNLRINKALWEFAEEVAETALV